MPETGKPAPDFTTINQDGETVSLADFRNKKHVVLYFYPRASTPGCTLQACGIRDIYKELEKREVTVLGISPDPVGKLTAFIQKQHLNFTLLSDEDHSITERYGCWGLKKFMGKEFMGVIRTTFIIGKDGKLLKILDKFKTKTHHEDLLTALDEVL